MHYKIVFFLKALDVYSPVGRQPSEPLPPTNYSLYIVSALNSLEEFLHFYKYYNMRNLLLIYSIYFFGFFQVHSLLASNYHLGDIPFGFWEIGFASTPAAGGSALVDGYHLRPITGEDFSGDIPPMQSPVGEFIAEEFDPLLNDWVDNQFIVEAYPNTGFTFSNWTINGSAITHKSPFLTISYRYWNGPLPTVIPSITNTINAVFIATDPNIDSDGDSLSDIKERQFGSDPLVADTYDSLVDIINSIDFTNLGDAKFTLQEITDLRAGSTMIAVENGQATLSMEVEQSDDLEVWNTLNFGDDEQDAEGESEEQSISASITVEDGTRFYRFKMTE